MTDLMNISKNFERNKKVITELLINNYGKEYADIIRERIDNTLFIFSSEPSADYRYIESHEDEIDKTTALMIKPKYYSHREKEKEFRNEVNRKIKHFLKNTIVKGRMTDETADTLLNLVANGYYGPSYIDAFSTKNDNLLDDSRTPRTIRDSIAKDRKYMETIVTPLGIKLSNISSYDVDKFIEYREALKTKYEYNICLNTTYGKSVFDAITQKFGASLPPERVYPIIVNRDSSSHHIKVRDGKNPFYMNIVQVPIVSLLNSRAKGIDVDIIHEIIHRVESNMENIGIEKRMGTNKGEQQNRVTNEIRTQLLAIKLTKQLHELGTFIYDNPNDYKLEGESIYESFFPLTKDFFEEHEQLFTHCAINNNGEELSKYFGPVWEKFSTDIDALYYHPLSFLKRENGYIDDKDRITAMINDMNEFEKGGTRHV